MAFAENTSNISLIAGTGGTTVFTFVELSGSTVITADSEGAEAIGVAAETVVALEAVPVSTQQGSIVTITLGEDSMSAGDAVMSDTLGRATASTGAGNLSLGFLLEDGDENEIVAMLFQISRRHA